MPPTRDAQAVSSEGSGAPSNGSIPKSRFDSASTTSAAASINSSSRARRRSRPTTRNAASRAMSEAAVSSATCRADRW